MTEQIFKFLNGSDDESSNLWSNDSNAWDNSDDTYADCVLDDYDDTSELGAYSWADFSLYSPTLRSEPTDEITKVEVGVEAYASVAPEAFIFSYQLSAGYGNDTLENWIGTSDDDSIHWLDITNDSSISPGTWTWNYISGLAAIVYAYSDNATTIYADQFYLRITYTPETPEGPVWPKDTGLDLSTRDLNFEMEEGGDNPDDQTFTISNSGDSVTTMLWQAHDNRAWITTTPTSGNDVEGGGVDTITVSVDGTGFTNTDSPYTGSVAVTAASGGVPALGSPKGVQVTLTVNEPTLIDKIAQSSNSTDNVSSMSLNVPAGTRKNDLILFIGSCDGDGYLCPTGFTELKRVTPNGSSHTDILCYKVAEVEPNSYTINTSGAVGERGIGAFVTYRGVDYDDPIDGFSFRHGGQDTTGVLEALTPSDDDHMVVASIGLESGNAGNAVIDAWPDSLEEQLDNDNGPPGTAAASSSLAIAQRYLATAEEISGNITIDAATGNTYWTTFLTSLSPSGVGEPQWPKETILDVDPTTFTDTITAGEYTSGSFGVDNIGEGTFQWTTTVFPSASHWLSTDPASGNSVIADTLIVSIEGDNMFPSGSPYVSNIEVAAVSGGVAASGSPVNFQVRVNVFESTDPLIQKLHYAIIKQGTSEESDEFNDTTIDAKWTQSYQTGGSASESGGQLNIDAGNQYIDTSSFNGNGLYQEFTGNFDYYCKIDAFNLWNGSNNEQAGMAAWIDSTHYMFIGRDAVTRDALYKNGGSNGTTSISDTEPMYVRLARSGSTITSYWSSNGTSWNQIHSQALGSTTCRIWLHCSANVASVLNADYDYFYDIDANLTDVPINLFDNNQWSNALGVETSAGPGYAELGTTDDPLATDLRIRKGGTTYAVLNNS